MTQENSDFDDEFLEFFIKPVLMFFGAAFIFLSLLSLYAQIQCKNGNAVEFSNLTKFLTEHGGRVKITGVQDEFIQHKGKYITTYNQLWYLCEFPDKYVIEIPRNHNGSTNRVPQLNEVWELQIYTSKNNLWPSSPGLYLHRKVE